VYVGDHDRIELANASELAHLGVERPSIDGVRSIRSTR
jgi:hypothetical protein